VPLLRLESFPPKEIGTWPPHHAAPSLRHHSAFIALEGVAAFAAVSFGA
jgi:hypothetical protein